MISTNGNALAGSLAATLQAVEIEKLVACDHDYLAAGREVLFDARSHALVTSRLVQNPSCRFSHERTPIGSAAGLTLRTALALGDGAGASLFVPDSPFVSKLVCERCDCTNEVWLLRDALEKRGLLCPHCREPRAVRGFDLFERISAETVPGRLLDRPLAERGLRVGDVIGVSDGEHTRFAALDLERPPSDGATLVIAGLGNIGSFLTPLISRMSGVASVILCDPDVYEARQVFGQNIAANAAGRGKADFQAERMRAIRPDLHVESFTAPVEQLPLGRLIGAIAVSCLDSRAARLHLAARAWRVGSPFVDAAVGGGASMLARTAVYLPDEDAACFECAFDESDYAALEQVLPCAAST